MPPERELVTRTAGLGTGNGCHAHMLNSLSLLCLQKTTATWRTDQQITDKHYDRYSTETVDLCLSRLLRATATDIPCQRWPLQARHRLLLGWRSANESCSRPTTTVTAL